MRALTLAVMAVSSACAPAALKDAVSLHAYVRTGESANGPTTLVELWFGADAGCPFVASTTIARFNGSELTRDWPGGTTTGQSAGSRDTYSYCRRPTWVASQAPAPPAQEVVEITDGRTSLKAVFDTPVGTIELLDPPNGALPVGVESAKVVVRAGLVATALRDPGALGLFYNIACEDLQARAVAVDGERREFTVEAIRTRSGYFPLPSGTHHCAVRFTYDLTAADCNPGDCSLRREGAQVFAASQPDQRLGFDLIVP